MVNQGGGESAISQVIHQAEIATSRNVNLPVGFFFFLRAIHEIGRF